MKALCFACAFAVLADGTALSQTAEPLNLQTEYIVSTWSQSDGFPAVVGRALAQDVAGYIWVGTDAGLYRFDGLHFVPIRLGGLNDTESMAPIRMLLASRDGGLWIALSDGRIAHHLANLTEYLDPLPSQARGTVSALVEDSQGVLWVGCSAGLFKHVSKTSPSWIKSSIDVPVINVRIDRSGRLLVVTADTLYRGSLNNTAFEPLEARAQDVRDVAEAPDGELYATDPIFGFRPIHAPAEPRSTEPTRGMHLIADRQGNLWVGTGGQGLWRWTRDRSTEHFSAARITGTTGLLAGGVLVIIEDREGNIWAGTPAGLSRLTRRKVQLIPNLLLVAGAEQTPDGSLWVGTSEELLRFSSDASAGPVERWSPGSQIRAIHADRKGTVWVATEQSLARVDDGKLIYLPTSGGFPRRIDNVTSLPGGGLIVFDLDRGLLRWQSGQFEKVPLPATLEAQPVVASYTDRTDRVWLAFDDGHLATLSAGRFEVYGEETGASAGRYNAIVEDDGGTIWFAGIRGLTRYRQGKFETLQRAQGFFSTILSAVILDRADNVWIGSGQGITRIERAELDKGFADSAYSPRLITYDRSDGLNGLPVSSYSRNRRAIRRPDGKLWFLTGQGITIADPAAMANSRTTFSVYVEGLTADGRRYDAGGEMVLPPRTRRVDLEFSALNLTFGAKTQFRYKLDSFDPSWIAAGARRQASYTNLPPGNYRFLVSASEGDGRWIDAGAPWAFTIRPAFYQTAWFSVTLAITAAAALWGGWRLHTRRVRREFSLLLRERTRVSREIHDRLLQNLVALTLEFDEAAHPVESRYPYGQLVRWRKLVEQYIVEARQSIWNLRSPVVEEKGFTALLKQNCERSAAGKGTDYVKFSITGQPRDCSANAEEQVLRIAQEAVLNASRHARANAVSVQLAFEEEHLSLTVSDDGGGFEPAAQRHHNDDHYGLKMMRERAENMGGVFDIASSRGEGTIVSVRVPAPTHKASR